MPNEKSFLSASPRGRRRRARRGATFQLAAIGWSQAFLSRADYDADENLRLALIYLIQVIGEAGRHVSREFCDQHPEGPWADIVGMRHKVVHDYLGVDEDIVWQVVTGDLPKLLVALERIVPPLSSQAE